MFNWDQDPKRTERAIQALLKDATRVCGPSTVPAATAAATLS